MVQPSGKNLGTLEQQYIIRIMSREEDIFRQKIYRYQIEGLNNEYTESYNPELVIRSLLPGSYRIMASCTAKDGSGFPTNKYWN